MLKTEKPNKKIKPDENLRKAIVKKRKTEDLEATPLKTIFDRKKRLENNKKNIKIFEKAVDTEGPQNEALSFSSQNGILPIFGKDMFKSFKSYSVWSYEIMKAVLLNPNIEKHYYEVLIKDIPSNFFVDSEIPLDLNQNIDLNEIHENFITYTKEFFIKCGYVSHPEHVKVTILDSSSPRKFSRHYIFRIINEQKKYFKTVADCGAFARRLQNYIIFEKEKLKQVEKSRFWFEHGKLNGQGETGRFYIDMAVYTSNRLFRTINSTKLNGKQPMPLIPYPEMSREDINNNFMDFFVQSDVTMNSNELIECYEESGGLPIYTSKVTYCRLDKSLTVPNGITSMKTVNDFFHTRFDCGKIWSMFGSKDREFRFEFQTSWKNMHFETRQIFSSFVESNNIVRIHIGALYEINALPKKNIVFDIDITDFKFRKCCSSFPKLCEKCILIIKLDALILNILLKKILGYSDVRFFFSGMKGIHCWVFDKKSLELDLDTRKKVIDLIAKKPQNNNSFLLNFLLSDKDVLNTLDEIKKEISHLHSNNTGLKLNENKILLKEFWPIIDKGPSYDIKHVVKCPLTVHTTTLVKAFEIHDLTKFSLVDINKNRVSNFD